ncbi:MULTISPECIES: hypothetical protein [unclassified Rhizobium]|uniref:hypothetical protein n=1 Tax=unclassified Rhizobium TaxID=2613769 RepID=UPI00216A44E2|nr:MULTISPECIES: hypothetical protein [unclassified Rhizobium]MCS3742597.1 hypothetical protein [Rhizobium sp. BK661]MCS4094563.1 hypothetical protein [Rhizobium sp. BK176]
MDNWTRKSDEEVFEEASEQPGSQASYSRYTEIRRRTYLLNKRVAESQMAASDWQIKAARATVETARWTKYSAIAVAASVIIASVSVIVQVVD